MDPQVKITSQIYFQRFRYGKENRGTRKHREEDFMEVKLQNIPEGAVMKVFCVKDADGQYPHPNSVDGHNCSQGVYCHPLSRRYYREETLKIPWLQINRTKKGDMAAALEERMVLLSPTYQGGCQALIESLRQGVKEDTNQVYLCVHVSWPNHQGVFTVSRLIKNEDKCSSLRIDELSHTSVSVDGGRILILMAEDSPAIEPEKIQVKMEEVNADTGITWTSETFIPVKEDIRYKHVITYHVPRYKDRQILQPVHVNLVIHCDQTNVEVRKEILYKPLPEFVALSRGKRKPSVAEKYGHKVLKVTDQRCVKEELRNKIKCGGDSDLQRQLRALHPPSTTNVCSMEHSFLGNHGNVPYTDDNGLGSSNDLLSDELPDFPSLPPQAPVSQKEAPQLMETDLNPTQEVKPLVRIPLSRDAGGSSRQFVAIVNETSSSSTDIQNHNLPLSVVELASTQDSIPDGGLTSVTTNSATCDKLTMMKRFMQNQHHAASTDGNTGFPEQISEQRSAELSPRNPSYKMDALEPNNLTSSPGHSGFTEPGQGGMESSQGISGFEIQNPDPDLGNTNGNLEQNGVLESIAGPLPSLSCPSDLMMLPSADLADLLVKEDVIQKLLQHSGEPD